MINVTLDANAYLDQRQAAWQGYEKDGRIRYDPLLKMVRVDDQLGDVIEALREKV